MKSETIIQEGFYTVEDVTAKHESEKKLTEIQRTVRFIADFSGISLSELYKMAMRKIISDWRAMLRDKLVEPEFHKYINALGQDTDGTLLVHFKVIEPTVSHFAHVRKPKRMKLSETAKVKQQFNALSPDEREALLAQLVELQQVGETES